MRSDKVILDLQQFAEGGEPGGDAGTEGGDIKPGVKYIEKVDPVTKKSFKIPAELEPVLGHFISATRSSIESQYKPLVEQIEKENVELKDIRTEYEKLKEQSMSAEQRAEANAKKVIVEHEKKAKIAIEEAGTWKKRFEEMTIKNDIYSSFGDAKLFNPSQAVLLFQNEGEARISEVVDESGKPTGRFETRVTLMLENDKGEVEKVEGTPTELFKRWIKLDRNLHHVQNDVNVGAGTKPTASGMRKGKVDMTLHPTERMKQYREQQTTKQ